MSLDSRQTTKERSRIWHLGLEHREALVIQSLFSIEPKLHEKYIYGPPSEEDPPDILFVNAERHDAMKEWEQWRQTHPHLVSIFVAEDTEMEMAGTVIRRPLAFRKFMEILTAITSGGESVSIADNTAQPEMKVLVVDDSFPARQFMKIKLEEIASDIASMRVDFAASGEEALYSINCQQYDLIFLDVIMPGMDGYELCQRIKTTCDARVALLTGQTMRADQARGRKAGCDHYVAKPPRDKELHDVIQLAMSTRSGAA